MNWNRTPACELESHTGLFLQTSYEEYEFAHKSLQEYLSAEYLVRLPQIPFEKNLLNKLPNELALAVAISSNPTLYLSNLFLVNLQIAIGINQDFLRAFISRLQIEKPDFVTEPILGVTFMLIAEKLSSIKSLELFEKIASTEQAKMSIMLMLQYYSVEKPLKSGQNSMVTLRNIKTFSNDVTSYLPEKISINKDFLNTFLTK